MMRGLAGAFQAGMVGLANRIRRFRVVVIVELVAFLAFAVALTIAPQITLGWVASAAAAAKEFSLSYRPLVALIGLALFVVTSLGLWAILRLRQSARSESSG